MNLENKIFEYTKEEQKVLKTERHCAWYLSSTTKNGLYTNPIYCLNCDGLNETCENYQKPKTEE